MLRLLIAAALTVPVIADAAPITIRLEGVISNVNFFGRPTPTGAVGSTFSAAYTFDTDNAKFVVDQVDDEAEVFGASSQIGCRGLLNLSSCVWDDGPGSPVVTSYRVSTIWGDFYGLPPLGFGDTSGVMQNRALPSISPPDGNEVYSASKSQAIYLLFGDLDSLYLESLFQRSWSLFLRGSSGLFGDYDDLTVPPNLAAADNNYFFFNELLDVRRLCNGQDCTDPVYGRGSFTFEGQLTAISIPEPGALGLLGLLALFAVRRFGARRRVRTTRATNGQI